MNHWRRFAFAFILGTGYGILILSPLWPLAAIIAGVATVVFLLATFDAIMRASTGRI